MDKKYELTDEMRVTRIDKNGKEYGFHRIRALKDFGDVKAGDIGGWVDSEHNLSQRGTSWIYDNAIVCDNAFICDDAGVCDESLVCGDATVCGNARIGGKARIGWCAKVGENAIIAGKSLIIGDAQVYGDAYIRDEVCISGNAKVCGGAVIGDYKYSCLKDVSAEEFLEKYYRMKDILLYERQ